MLFEKKNVEKNKIKIFIYNVLLRYKNMPQHLKKIIINKFLIENEFKGIA